MAKFTSVGVSGVEQEDVIGQEQLQQDIKRKVQQTPYITGGSKNINQDYVSRDEARREKLAQTEGMPITEGEKGSLSGATSLRALGETSPETEALLNNPDMMDLLNLSPEVVAAMEETGLLPFQGGLEFDPEVEQRGQIAAFTNKPTEELIESGMMPVGQGGIQKKTTSGTYIPMTKPEAVDNINWLKNNAANLNKVLLNASIDNTGQPTLVGQTIAKEFGPQAVARPEVGMNMILGYYRALEEASYADYSDAEKAKFKAYEKEFNELHPDLYESKEGRPAMTPKRRVMEEQVGKYIEEVSGIKFSSKENRDIIGQSVLRGMTRMNPNDSLLFSTTEYAGPEGYSTIETETTSPVYGIDTNRLEMRNKLNLTKGIRDALQPNFRNNSRVLPKKEKKDINQELTGKQRGVSRIRTHADNIIEEMPMMLDQHFITILNTTWQFPEWAEFWEGNDAKIKEEHLNILLQQDAHVKQNSPDGKTYYADRVLRGSGRKGSKTLLMEDIKAVRFASIPRDYVTNIPLASLGKYNAEEKEFIAAVMANLGGGDRVFSSSLAMFKEFEDPNFEGRKLGAMLNELGRTGQIPEGLTPQRLKDSGFMEESGDSIQSLRAIDGYFKAKENPKQNNFLTKFIGEIDASQSGQTIQAMMLGNYDSYLRGGGRSPEWLQRMDSSLKLELPKLYESATAHAASAYDASITEDKMLSEMVNTIFGSSEGDKFNKSFAKIAIQGASYGQGKFGAQQAIKSKIMEWTNGLPLNEKNNIVSNLNSLFKEEAIGLDTNNNIQFLQPNTELEAKLDTYSDFFVEGMRQADPRILEYSKRMRGLFTSYVKIAAFAKNNNIQFGEPEMAYYEPSDINNPYGAKWKKGMRTSMIEKHIPSEYLSTPFLGEDIVGDMAKSWEELPIYYKEGKPQVDYDKELSDLENISSEAITRFPVVSIHGLDDLAISIAVSEMARKYPNDFKYFMSVWDAGRVPPLLRSKFSKEYNKALLETIKNNNFFLNLSTNFRNFVENIPADVKKKLNNSPKIANEFETLKNNARRLYQESLSLKTPRLEKAGKGGSGINLINELAGNYGFANMDPGTPEFETSIVTGIKSKPQTEKQKTVTSSGLDLMNRLADLGL